MAPALLVLPRLRLSIVSTETSKVNAGTDGRSIGTFPKLALEFESGRFVGRVALLTNFIPPYRLRMLEMLSAAVRELHVFLSVYMEENRDWTPDWGSLHVTVQRNISFSRTFGSAMSYRERSLVHIPWNTIPQLVAYNPDVVISAEFGMRTLQAAVYCFLFRKPLMVWATLSEMTERNRGRLRHGLRHILLRFVDHVLVNGSSGERYIRRFGFPKERIHVVPQASDNEAFEGPITRNRSDMTRLLYTGQLIERKGLRHMHEALVRWCRAHPERFIRWTIVGSGPLRETVESWRGPLNYELEVLGPLPFASVAEQYHAADFYVFPTLADEWGLVVNEAMAAGLPVLGSVYSQAVLDIVVDGLNGWTFRPDRPDELDRALERAMMTSATKMNAMRRAAVDTIKPLDQRSMCNRILMALGAAVPGLILPTSPLARDEA